MPKNRIFKITDGSETKDVEALSFKKAVKSYQGGSKSKMITIECTTKSGKEFEKQKKLPPALQKAILKKMKEDGKITEEEAEAASKLLSKDDQKKEEVAPQDDMKVVENPKKDA